MEFTKLPTNTFKNLQLNAGVLVREFTPSTGTVAASNIIGATTGGVNFTATPTYSDFGEDIDNCPTNMMEFKQLDSWECTMSGTFVSADRTLIKQLIGPADADTSDQTKVTPRNNLTSEDFEDIWWIGDYSDVNTGDNAGFLAVHLINSLSNDGIQIQSTDSGKGNFAFNFMGHYSLDDQDKVPFEIFVKAGTSK